MPLSQFLKIWPCREEPDRFILYSTRKGSVVRLSAALLETARNDSLPLSARNNLLRLQIMVDDPVAEREFMRGIIHRANIASRKFRTQIVLNLDCNLACTYCYEEGFRNRQYMSGETGRLVVDTIIRDQIGAGLDVEIDFYGGEPLLSLNLLKEIATSLRDASQHQGTGFSFFLFTNGTLLTRKLAEELVPLGLKGALLTLDGPREIHDRQRPFVSGNGSFDLIVSRIREVCDLIDVEIGGNYNSETYGEFPLVLDHLLSEGVTPDRIKRVQFSPIVPKSSPTALFDGNCQCAPANDDCIIEAVPYLQSEIRKREFKQSKPIMAACPVDFHNFLVINFDGTLYKCPAFMGWPELSIGTLVDGIRDYSNSHQLLYWQNDECLACSYLPLCFGGCRLNPLLKNGIINEVDCRKGFFDATLQRIVQQNLK